MCTRTQNTHTKSLQLSLGIWVAQGYRYPKGHSNLTLFKSSIKWHNFIYDFHISNDLISTVILFFPYGFNEQLHSGIHILLSETSRVSSFQMFVYCGLNLRRKNLQKLNLFSVHYSLTVQNYRELGWEDASVGKGLAEQAWHPEFGPDPAAYASAVLASLWGRPRW